MLVTAPYTLRFSHCTYFTDMDLAACFFGFANIIIILLYYHCCCIMCLLPCHGEIKIIIKTSTSPGVRCYTLPCGSWRYNINNGIILWQRTNYTTNCMTFYYQLYANWHSLVSHLSLRRKCISDHKEENPLMWTLETYTHEGHFVMSKQDWFTFPRSRHKDDQGILYPEIFLSHNIVVVSHS